MAFPEVAVGDHVGSIEGERALFQLAVTAGDQHDICESSKSCMFRLLMLQARTNEHRGRASSCPG